MKTPTHEEVARATYDWRNGKREGDLLEWLEEEAAIAAAETGADREPGYDIDGFVEKWIGKWLGDHREPPARLAHRILRLLYDHTESWEEGYVGSEAAYLAMSILATEEPNKKVMWILHEDGGSRYDRIFRLLLEHTRPWDPVWDHIIIGTFYLPGY